MNLNTESKRLKDFHNYLETVRPELDAAFGRELSLLLSRLPFQHFPLLTDALMNGKKIRGCLSCMMTDALGGSLESAIPRAIAVELLHLATLIHDDFVDQDRTRRNQPAIWTLEGARNAVLIGDLLFATAVKMMTDLSMQDGSVISLAIAQMSKGALREPLDFLALMHEIESGGLNERLYEEIIYLKTGVLFGAACRLGAIAAQADSRIQESSFRYGLRIGEAYQIADDLDDLKVLLSKPSVQREEITPLVPMFLYLDSEMHPWILEMLRGKCQRVSSSILETARRLEGRMREEIELRLKSAISEIDGNVPNRAFSELIHTAPWDLIKIFSPPQGR